MLRRATALAFALTLFAASSAHAGDPRAADALFKEGRAAFDKGDFPTACTKFEASQKADPAAGTLLNLGLCEERAGRLLSAKQHLAEVIASLPPKDDRLPLARDTAAKVDKRLASITLTLAADAPADTKIQDGGRALRAGAAEPMEPGDHDLLITAAGRPEGHLKLTLAEGQKEQRQIAVAAAAGAGAGAPIATVGPEAPAPPDQPQSSAPTRRIIGIAAAGVGVASLGAAAVTGALLLGKKSGVDAHCPNKRCDATGLSLKADAEKTALLPVNTATWIVGLAGVGAGAVLILTSLGGGSPAPAKSAIVYPAALPGGAGVGVSGSF
jgi:hypothetical protein